MTGPGDRPHVPVLIDAILDAVAPVGGRWIDATFGAGGYAGALLDAGAEEVIGIDRDPSVFDLAKPLADRWGAKLRLVRTTFSNLDAVAGGPVDGVVMDLGVSSMQLDRAERGFSFMADGPLDMRMSREGRSAEDFVNAAPEAEIADVLYHYGEERASRRIARAIVERRAVQPIRTTAELAALVSACLPRPKPGQSHPATRAFQAIRIAVNDEFGQLVAGLEAAERALAPGGHLAVVTFHSLEDRVVKRFLQDRSGGGGRANRFAPEAPETTARFEKAARARTADEAEVAANPRARSATLRIAVRTEASAGPSDRGRLGLPKPVMEGPT